MISDKQLYNKFYLILIGLLFLACSNSTNQNANFHIVGQMKDVMWKGKLEPTIQLDTIKKTEALYGLGPVSFLTGELVINNGQTYVSKVTSDTTMVVEKTNKIGAPFFVYANNTEWNSIDLPKEIQSILELENFIKKKSIKIRQPFVFKLEGKIHTAKIHIQNLPKGSIVRSPKQAHQGQINYKLREENCTIIGFYSESHQGVFTHHDSYLHMHLLTNDEQKMGHLDEVDFKTMKLYLPKN